MNRQLKPEEITVIRDRREKANLAISPLKWVPGTLKTGDFSIDGHTDKVTIELKALNDIVSCVTHERQRFERELDRMRTYPYRLIVVKSTWSAIMLKQYRSSVTPNAVLGSLMAFTMNANVSIVMADNDANAGTLVAKFLYVAANRIHRASQKQVEPPTSAA